MLTTHVLERLQSRNIRINPCVIEEIARNTSTDAAILLAKLNNHVGSTNNDYYARKESNGDLVYLIVRDNRPITIMYRRSNQPSTPESMRVNVVIDLSADLKNFIRVL